MRNDVKITGGSDATMTNEELKDAFRYASSSDYRAWGNNSLYYEGNDDATDVNTHYLGYKHDKTGTIFMLQNYRHASACIKTVYNLDGTKSAGKVFKSDVQSARFGELTSAMKKIAPLKAWDIVLCTVKESVRPVFNQLHLWSSGEYMPKTDLSIIFQAVEVVQKGCKTIPHVKIPTSKETIQKTNKIEKVII